MPTRRGELPQHGDVVGTAGFELAVVGASARRGVQRVEGLSHQRVDKPVVVHKPSDHNLFLALLTFLWVDSYDRPGSGGQRPPRVRSAMAISDSGLW